MLSLSLCQRLRLNAAAGILCLLGLVAPVTAEHDMQSPPSPSEEAASATLPDDPNATTPPLTSDAPSVGGEPPSILPAEPIPTAPTRLFQQINLLLIEDQVAGNQYVTTLDVSGATVRGAQSPMLFGVRQPMGRNSHPVTWYPHPGAEDIAQFTSVNPSGLFRGVSDGSGQPYEGEFIQRPLPSVRHTNLLFHESAFEFFRNQGIGAQSTLMFTTTLLDGSERSVETQMFKRAQLILKRSMGLQCREDTVEGMTGKVCLIREVQSELQDISNNDIHFMLRGEFDQAEVRYRVGQQWHPLGTPIPIAEFAHGRGIELFVSHQPHLAESMMQNQGNANVHLEGGFYSATRHAKGDRFALALGNTPGLAPENLYHMSRIEVMLVEEPSSGKHYLTTLRNQGTQGKAASLFGVNQPNATERAAIWSLPLLPGTSFEQEGQVVLSPDNYFQGFSDEGGQPHTRPSLGVHLSETGWQQLLSSSLGQTQLWRYETLRDQQHNLWLTHVVKVGHLLFHPLTSPTCRAAKVQEVQGWVCPLYDVQWQGIPTSGGDLRFSLSSRLALPEARYKVAEQWVNLNDSVPLLDLAHSQQVEFFYVPSTAEQAISSSASSREALPLSQLHLSVFSASRMNKGDRFQLKPSISTLPPTRQDPMSTQFKLLLVNSDTQQNQYVTHASNDVPPGHALFGVSQPSAGERIATWYSPSPPQSLNLRQSRSTSPPQLQPAEWFSGFAHTEGSTRHGDPSPIFSTAFWQHLLTLPVGESISLQQAGGATSLQAELSKVLQVTLRQPAAPECQAETVQGIEGVRCVIQQLHWQGRAPLVDTLRLEVRSMQERPEARYRVGEQWYPLGESIPLNQALDQKQIELFLTSSDLQTDAHILNDRIADKASKPLQIAIYSSERRQQGDQFSLPISLPLFNAPSAQEKLNIDTLTLDKQSFETGESLTVKVLFNRPPRAAETLYFRLLPRTGGHADASVSGLQFAGQTASLSPGKWVSLNLDQDLPERTDAITLSLPEALLAKGAKSAEFILEVTSQPPVRLQSRSALTSANSIKEETPQVQFQVRNAVPQPRADADEFYVLGNDGKQLTFVIKHSWWSKGTVLVLNNLSLFRDGKASCTRANGRVDSLDISLRTTNQFSCWDWQGVIALLSYTYYNAKDDYNIKSCRFTLPFNTSMDLSKSYTIQFSSFMHIVGGMSSPLASITFTPNTRVNNVNRITTTPVTSGETVKFNIALFAPTLSNNDKLTLSVDDLSGDALNSLDLTQALFKTANGSSSQAVSFSAGKASVNLTADVQDYVLEIPSKPFYTSSDKTFTFTAQYNTGQPVSVTGTLKPSKERVKTITDVKVLKGEPALFTVTLAQKLPANTPLYFQVPNATDYQDDLQLTLAYVMGIPLNLANGETFITLPADTENFVVEIPTIKRAITDPQKKVPFSLAASSQPTNSFAPKGKGLLYPERVAQPTGAPTTLTVASGNDIALTIPLTEAVVGQQKLGINYTPLSTPPAPVKFDQARVDQQPVAIVDDQSETRVDLTHGQTEVSLRIPTEVFYGQETRAVNVNLRGADAQGVTVDHPIKITLTPNPNLKVDPINNIEATLGTRARFTLKTDRIPKAGDALFFKLGFSSDGVKPQDLGLNQVVLSTQSGTPLKTLIFNAPYEQSFSFEQDQTDQTFTLDIPVNLPTASPSQARTFTLAVNGGVTAEANPALGTATILPISSDITLSVDSRNMSGDMDSQQTLRKTITLDWKLGNINLDNLPLKQQIEQRALKNPASVSLNIKGESDTENPDLCLLTLTSGTPLGKKVRFPSYLAYPLATGSGNAQIRHGCGTRGANLQAAQWKNMNATTANTYHYQLPVELVFELNQALSQTTSDNLPWVGTASTTLNLSTQVIWNSGP